MKKLLVLLLACLGLTACNNNVIEPKGISRTYVNDEGYLMVVYTDGTEENAGYVKGEKGDQGIQGVAGENGKDGSDGKDGLNGQDGKDGKDGETIIITTQPEQEENYVLTSTENEIEEELIEENEPEVYTYEVQACDLSNAQIKYEFENIFEMDCSLTSHPSTGRVVFGRGELKTKPGYIIKEILVACPDRMANVYFFNDNYENVNPNFNSAIVSCISLQVTNLNEERLHIIFMLSDASMHDYYGPSFLRIKYTTNENYVQPEEYVEPIHYGYAGLQVYNNNNQEGEYKVGILGESVTSKELEEYILSLHPGYKIYAKNYSSFTTTYIETQFTTRKVYIRKEA